MNSNQPDSKNFLKWFDPRNRKLGSWAFILNRITAIGLTVYLFLHLVMLSKLAQGPEAYNAFIKLAKTPVVLIGEMFVVAGGIIHALNGIRIGLNSMGIGTQVQKQLFVFLMFFAVAGIAVFGIKMLGGE